jgi:hypothetical protein
MEIPSVLTPRLNSAPELRGNSGRNATGGADPPWDGKTSNRAFATDGTCEHRPMAHERRCRTTPFDQKRTVGRRTERNDYDMARRADPAGAACGHSICGLEPRGSARASARQGLHPNPRHLALHRVQRLDPAIASFICRSITRWVSMTSGTWVSPSSGSFCLIASMLMPCSPRMLAMRAMTPG